MVWIPFLLVVLSSMFGCHGGKIGYRKDELVKTTPITESNGSSNGELSGFDIIINNGGFSQIGGISYGGGVSNGQGNGNIGGGTANFGGETYVNLSENMIKWLPNCDFSGHDIGNQPSSGDQCGNVCVFNNRCNAFSWHDGNCYMKSVPSPNLSVPADGGLCGFLPWKF